MKAAVDVFDDQREVFMKIRLVLFSLLCGGCTLIYGCTSAKLYMEDIFSVEKRACSKGDGKSCSLLGALYYFGSDSMKQSFTVSLKYYKAGCDNNHAQSCNRVGLMYELGEGVKKNDSQAKFYFAKGCQMKNISACKSYKRLN